MATIDSVKGRLARFEKEDSAPIQEGPLSATEERINKKVREKALKKKK